MMLAFFKAHAYGNDFLCAPVDQTTNVECQQLARRICDRHVGVGADGLILYASTKDGATMTLYNADGGVAEVSGNGVRCLAAWIAKQRSETVDDMSDIVIDTDGGRKSLALLEQNGQRYLFQADMGQPMSLKQEELNVAGHPVRIVSLSVGNPQCVVLMPSYEEAERRFQELGSTLTAHDYFPDGTNVELVVVERPDRIRVLIWERGVGPTSSSGTGACASAVAAAGFGGANRVVDVVSQGGAQRVEWDTNNTITLTGWAELLAHGQWWLSKENQ
jgi:diaminopimelate epimerase